jgi:hypothetical protein
MADTSGTKVVSKIVPTDTLDEYATHDADYGRGGYVSVADITARDAITTQRRKQGMTVYVNSTNVKYILKDGITNSDWVVDSSGGGGAVDSVNAQTGVVVLDADDIDDTATTNKFTNAAGISKLAGIEAGATQDQTGAEIKSLYEAESNTNVFTDAEKTKLANIEGAATQDQTAAEIKAAYESNANTNAFTDAEQAKLTSLTTTPDAADVVFDDTIAAIGETSLQLVVESLDTRLDSLEGAGGFTDPTTVSGCVMWLDAADDAAWTVNGSNEVTAWTDKSDNAMTSTIVNAPTRTVELNGQKCITFNGDRTAANADYIKLGTQISDALSGKTGVTTFYVYRNTKDMTTAPESQTGYQAQQILLDSWGGTEFTRLRHYIHEGYAPYEFCRDHGDNGGSRKIGEYDMLANDLKIVDHRSSIPNKSMDVLINGAVETWTTENLDYSKAVFETANGSAGTGNSEDSIGAECYDGTESGYPFGSTSFRGEICEIILYDRRLTATQMGQIRNYLANKWGKTVAGGDVSDGLNDLSDVSVVDNVDGHVLRYNASTSQYENGFPEDIVSTWANATSYAINNLVRNGEYIYRCTTAHTSASLFSTDASYWVEQCKTQGAIQNWITATGYVIDNVILSPADELYMCIANHTSSALFTSDSANWKSIAATGGGGATVLNDLTNVSVGAPTDTQVLTWVQANTRWEAVDSASGGGATTLSGLTDTTITSPADTQLLRYDNATSKWVNAPVATVLGDGNLGDLSNVDMTGLTDNYVLTYDSASGNWKPEAAAGGGGASSLDGLSDVAIGTLTNRDVLVYNTVSGNFENIGSLTETPSFDLPYLYVEGSDGSGITSSTNVDYKTVVTDTDSGWTPAGNYYVIPITGRYIVQASVHLTAYKSWSGVQVYLDSGAGYVGQGTMARNYSTDVALENFIISATAGDKLAIRWDVSGTLSTGATYHHLTIQGLAVTQNIALTPELTGKYQEKSLSADITAISTNVTALGFSSLTVGKMYQVSGFITCETTDNADNTKTILAGMNIGSGVSKLTKYNYTHTGATFTLEYNYIFEATQTTIVFSVNTLTNLKVLSTGAGTSMTLIEHPSSMEVTTDFT